LFPTFKTLIKIKNKKHVLFNKLLVCLLSSNYYSQIIKAGAYKLFYTEFKNNKEELPHRRILQSVIRKGYK